ncbi:MAG TPA: sigma-70 family RNA polymerase sigma factor [Polyangiaceae bacterium]|nr:sigma-70 family RNA polymerase sigma factor [Polyangiaceae bacterium]
MGSISPDETLLVALARRAHPSFEVDEGAFAEHLRKARERARGAADEGEGEGEGDADLHVDDLYLAFACLQGDRRALGRVSELLADVAESALGTMGVARAEREEVLQRTRQRLLVAEGGPPKLATYAGRGALKPWLRACVVRTALNLSERRRVEIADDEAWLSWPSPEDDPELALLRRSCAEAFRRAATEALEALPPAERLLLRQHYIDGLSAEQLGELHRVHFVTIYRRLERARRELLDATRQRLGQSLPLKGRELDSLVYLLGSQLEVSIRRLLSK